MLNITYYFCVDIITVYCKSYTMAFEQIHLIILIIGIILTILPILLYRSLSKKENIKESKPAKKELINTPIDNSKTIAPEAISEKKKKEEITSNSPTDTKKPKPIAGKEKYNSDIKKISLEGHNLRNIQERDYYLFYHKDTDSYYHNKEYLLTPVRDIIGGFFPFNLEEKARKKAIQENCSIQKIKDKWKHDGSLGKELGRHLHMQIENYFQNKKLR